MTESRRVWTWLPGLPGFRLFTSLWGSLLAVAAADAVNAPGWVAVMMVGCIVALSSLGQRAAVALMVGGVGWLVVTGFVVNDYGVLVLSGWSDAGRLGVLLAVALPGSRVGRHLDAILTPSGRVAPDGRRTLKVLVSAGPFDVRHAGEE